MTLAAPGGIFAALVARWDDLVPAIVVKEARQAVRSRMVLSAQMLLLAFLVVLLASVLLQGDDGDSMRGAGPRAFLGCRMILHLVAVVGVPLYVGARLAAERSEANTDLLFSTTLAPWQVVAGKLVSGLLLGLLAMSACAPFLVMCYFLRGVSLGGIGSALVDEGMQLVLCTVLGLFIGALPAGAVVKGVVTLVYLFFALGSFGRTATSFIHSPRAMPMVQAAAQVVPYLVGFMVVGLVFLLAVAMLAPATSNRAFAVRAYLAGAWVVSAGLGVLLNFALMSSEFKPFKVWVSVWSVLLAVATLVAVAERDRLGPRVRAQITTLNGKVNAAALLLFSGAASGLFFAAIFTVATLVFCVMSSFSLGWLFTRSTMDVSGVRELVLRLAVANAMTMGYALLGGCIRRKLWPSAPTSTSGFVAAALMLSAVVVPLIGLILTRGRFEDWKTACAGFPYACALMGSGTEVVQVFWMSAAWAGVLLAFGLVWSWPWFMAQLKVFKEARSVSPASLFPRKSAPPAAENPAVAKEADLGH